LLLLLLVVFSVIRFVFHVRHSVGTRSDAYISATKNKRVENKVQKKVKTNSLGDLSLFKNASYKCLNVSFGKKAKSRLAKKRSHYLVS